MTKVEIFNLALVRLKEPTVQATTESSHQAETLTVLYPWVVERMLRAHHFSFARDIAELVEHADDPPDGWGYRYTLPTDMVRPKRTYVTAVAGMVYPFDQSTNDLFLPYNMIPSDDDSELTLVSNYPALFLEYTKRTVDPLLWPVDFCDAVAWGLCVDAVVPLTGRSDLLPYATQGYMKAFSVAMTHNANSIQAMGPRDAGSIRARS